MWTKPNCKRIMYDLQSQRQGFGRDITLLGMWPFIWPFYIQHFTQEDDSTTVVEENR